MYLCTISSKFNRFPRITRFYLPLCFDSINCLSSQSISILVFIVNKSCLTQSLLIWFNCIHYLWISSFTFLIFFYIFFNVLFQTSSYLSIWCLWWAQMDLNHRPHAYQACALTSWAMSPYLESTLMYSFLLSITLLFNVLYHFSINLLLNSITMNFLLRYGISTLKNK